VKIIDANVLLYAVNRQSTEHQAAHRWLTSALSGTEVVGLPWVSLLAFIRLSTSRRIFASPLSPADAMTLVESWLAQPAAVTVEPTTRHSSVLRGLLEQAGTAGNLTTDAHIAALAIEHGAIFVTFDRDFERFDIRVQLPT
jgi:toxin-antitoxin system PIN domain toxin